MALTLYSFPLLLFPPSFWPILSSMIPLLNLPAGVGVTYPFPFPTAATLLHALVLLLPVSSSIPSQFLIEKNLLTQEYKVSWKV